MGDTAKDWRVELMEILRRYTYGSQREICFLEVAELLEKRVNIVKSDLKKQTKVTIIEQKAGQRMDDLISNIAKAIHYPKCWVTSEYPYLIDAVKQRGCPRCTRDNQIDKNCMNCGTRYSCNKVDTTNVSKCWSPENE